MFQVCGSRGKGLVSYFAPYVRNYSPSSISVRNPATSTVITSLFEDTEQSVVTKSDHARTAQLSWSKVPLQQRKAAIQKYRDSLAQKDTIAEFASALSSETGKPVAHASGEIKATLERIDYFLNNVDEVMKTKEYPSRGNVKETLMQEPIGVVGNISAWNFPYFVGHNVIIPALLTGNTVLYKPSEYALLTGNNIEKLLNESLPENVFQNIIGDGSVGQALLEGSSSNGKRLIDAIFFTGSNATGTKIAQAAGRKLMKVQLELGGKDGAYIHKDVPVDSVAASIADGAFYNNGQSCCSVERVFVHEAIYKEFVDRLVHHVSSFVMGDPSKAETYLGPLTRAQQADVLDNQVQDARNKGGNVIIGGKRKVMNNGVYYEPTVVSDCSPDMKVMREESFGPIVAVSVVSDSLNEVVEKMNDCEYGLTNSVFSVDQDVAEKIFPQLQSGTVYWNSCDRVSPQLPWSGRNGSGIGATLGEIGISTFLQPKGYHRNPKI